MGWDLKDIGVRTKDPGRIQGEGMAFSRDREESSLSGRTGLRRGSTHSFGRQVEQRSRTDPIGK